MHQKNIQLWQHQHHFQLDKKQVERKVFLVVIITAVTMLVSIFFGWLTNSMALFADGWHMGTHVFALGISLFAYVLARKYANDGKFSFGTWRIEILGAYSSAIVLGMAGLMLIPTSVQRLINPLDIQYNQALIVATIGLMVNVVCAFILSSASHSHNHSHHNHNHNNHNHNNHNHHNHNHNNDHQYLPNEVHRDLNLRSAYLHVIADALTSVFAIFALLGAKYYHLNWLDPFMGIVGATMIIRWSFLLLKDSGNILLGRERSLPLTDTIKAQLELDGDTKVSDLHLWKVADEKFACIVSLVTGQGRDIIDYRRRLADFTELAHVTIEINHCSVGT